MIKLLICLVSGLALAACVLQLRQQRLEMAYQTAELHDRVRAQQAKLWNQQLQIASCTAPNAITSTVNTHDLKMVAQTPLPDAPAHWTNSPRRGE